MAFASLESNKIAPALLGLSQISKKERLAYVEQHIGSIRNVADALWVLGKLEGQDRTETFSALHHIFPLYREELLNYMREHGSKITVIDLDADEGYNADNEEIHEQSNHRSLADRYKLPAFLVRLCRLCNPFRFNRAFNRGTFAGLSAYAAIGVIALGITGFIGLMGFNMAAVVLTFLPMIAIPPLIAAVLPAAIISMAVGVTIGMVAGTNYFFQNYRHAGVSEFDHKILSFVSRHYPRNLINSIKNTISNKNSPVRIPMSFFGIFAVPIIVGVKALYILAGNDDRSPGVNKPADKLSAKLQAEIFIETDASFDTTPAVVRAARNITASIRRVATKVVDWVRRSNFSFNWHFSFGASATAATPSNAYSAGCRVDSSTYRWLGENGLSVASTIGTQGANHVESIEMQPMPRRVTNHYYDVDAYMQFMEAQARDSKEDAKPFALTAAEMGCEVVSLKPRQRTS